MTDDRNQPPTAPEVVFSERYVEAKLAAAFQRGFEKGFTQACEAGFDFGKKRGFEEGFKEAYTKGFEAGKHRGYEEGYEEACVSHGFEKEPVAPPYPYLKEDDL